MVKCPRCKQAIASDAVSCPHCQFILKAHGHPGIPLHRSQGEGYLCDTCIYHADDTCDFPQRPTAKDCTLYHNQEQPLVPESRGQYRGGSWRWRSWFQKNSIWIILLALLIVSLWLSI
ncbi:zinc ribbon domain-containing protein [Roseofilum reptotaenium CS-1145]|uniref:Zinc ribbon domain-containing protein n=1 Tax=Roseofilum reptotaenium AO1-A TaxID=1925591 RepID=A0A1L9QY02_9CYAN|nr:MULTISPECIES: zinc ribbon domain-containing protein [Roseofilum]MBP0031018.1 zinc ribbon domain-containing protein [Roseofilum sp. Guam]MDB9517800.1 zinc ribbon domain-containing protein [Roseofilum reptotaenium CS-1145]OJJ27543.1 zinc ribbon domain-containing protein [Roseofilum reptotaenium AO1-A]